MRMNKNWEANRKILVIEEQTIPEVEAIIKKSVRQEMILRDKAEKLQSQLNELNELHEGWKLVRREAMEKEDDLKTLCKEAGLPYDASVKELGEAEERLRE